MLMASTLKFGYSNILSQKFQTCENKLGHLNYNNNKKKDDKQMENDIFRY